MHSDQSHQPPQIVIKNSHDLDQHRIISTSESVNSSLFEKEKPSKSWPKVVYFILIVEFCERFCYYGLRSVLTLFFDHFFGFDEKQSSSFYHVFSALCYGCPILGAIISDSYWGRFKTIRNFCFIYVIGTICLTLSSIPTIQIEDPTRTFHKTIGQIGLFLIALGNGGIKPCVVAFGADQFKQEQTEAKEQYFKLFYATINAGAVIAAYLTPELRKFDCYPEYTKDQFVDTFNSTDMASVFDQCHRNSFMLTSISMGMGLILFMVPVFYTWMVTRRDYSKESKLCYKIEDKKEGSIIFEFFGAIFDAFKGLVSKVTPGHQDQGFFKYARNYTNAQRYSFNIVVKIFILFLPLLFFHASLEAIGTLWTYQAKELNGFMPWAKPSCKPKPLIDYILADQMEVFNNLFVLLFTPVITLVFLPCHGSCKRKISPSLFLI